MESSLTLKMVPETGEVPILFFTKHAKCLMELYHTGTSVVPNAKGPILWKVISCMDFDESIVFVEKFQDIQNKLVPIKWSHFKSLVLQSFDWTEKSTIYPMMAQAASKEVTDSND